MNFGFSSIYDNRSVLPQRRLQGQWQICLRDSMRGVYLLEKNTAYMASEDGGGMNIIKLLRHYYGLTPLNVRGWQINSTTH